MIRRLVPGRNSEGVAVEPLRSRCFLIAAAAIAIGGVSPVQADGSISTGTTGNRVMLVSSFVCFVPGCSYEDAVLKYDYTTGAFLGVHVSNVPGAYGLALHPERGTLLVVSRDTDSVREHNLVTGQYIRTLITSGAEGLHFPQNILVKPDGNLLVSSAQTEGFLGRFNGILEFDPDGNFVRPFADGGFQGSGCGDPRCLLGVNGMVYGPNGNVYAASGANHLIMEFHGISGEYVGYFDSLRLVSPSGIVIRPPGTTRAGNILVTSKYRDPANPNDTDKVVEFSPVTRELISTWQVAKGFKSPGPLKFHDDGSLLVSDRLFWDIFPRYSDKILKLNGSTGAFVGTFTPSDGSQLHWATAMLDVTITPTNVNSDYDGDGDVDLRDFLYFQLCFGPSPISSATCVSSFDDNQNGEVELGDVPTFAVNLVGPQP